MKVRQGFVSNSSSSSFIIKKDSLTESQLEDIMFLIVSNGGYETDIEVNDETHLIANLEAHNGIDDEKPLSQLIVDLMWEFDFKSNQDYKIEYGGWFRKEDLK